MAASRQGIRRRRATAAAPRPALRPAPRAPAGVAATARAATRGLRGRQCTTVAAVGRGRHRPRELPTARTRRDTCRQSALRRGHGPRRRVTIRRRRGHVADAAAVIAMEERAATHTLRARTDGSTRHSLKLFIASKSSSSPKWMFATPREDHGFIGARPWVVHHRPPKTTPSVIRPSARASTNAAATSGKKAPPHKPTPRNFPRSAPAARVLRPPACKFQKKQTTPPPSRASPPAAGST